MRVRTAFHGDAPTIVDFQLRMAKETEALELDRATVERGVSAVFHDHHKGQYWVAEVDGQVAASLLTVPEWSDWRSGTVIWIHSVYVLPEYRKKGVFRAMYAHLRSLVQSTDAYKGLRLYVDRRNTAAQRVYENLGMDGSHYAMFEWLKT